MAIMGILMSALANFSPNGCSLQYSVNLHDDQLGLLGNKGYTVDVPEIAANVLAYVEQMLPTMESQVGIPIILPPQANTANT